MLKDTDIDDLFRRASDKYPLRTDGADWNKMAAALDKTPVSGESNDTDTNERRRNRRLFWLLLFLPLGGAGYFALHHSGNGSSHGVAAVATARMGDKHLARTNESPAPTNETPATGGAQKAEANETPATVNGQTAVAPAVPGDRATAEMGFAASSAARKGSGSTTPTSQGGTDHPGVTTAIDPAASRPQGTVSPARSKTADQPGTVAGQTAIEAELQPAGDQSTIAAGPGSTTRYNRRGGKPGAPGQSGPVAALGANGTPANRSTTETNEPLTLRWDGADMRLAPTTRDYLVSVNVTAPGSPASNAPAKQNPAGQKAARQKPTHYFYAGVFAAPDFSTVKMQSVKKVGTTFGVLVGYAINAHWSIETGASVDRKNYYTQGEYFDTTHVHMQPDSRLLNASGTCYMWEIPLNVRYNFNPDGKTKWFGTAGFSTYLMSKENYSFEVQKNSYSWYYSWNNKQPSQYPFSIVNLSAGFEQRLGRVGSLRMEPYVRLPLGGIGTGKLPIMSAGVNIGITRRLW